MWKTGDPEMATPKRVRTHRPKHSNTSLFREWRINMANEKKNYVGEVMLVQIFTDLKIEASKTPEV